VDLVSSSDLPDLASSICIIQRSTSTDPYIHLAFCRAGGAPLTKALVMASVSTSIIVQAASKASRRRRNALVESFIHAVAFKHPGELFFGALLTYYFRLLERQMGTSKYGAYALISCGIGYAFEAGLTATAAHRTSASGLYPLLFANMVAFFLEIPSLQRFSVFGITLSDKAFIYLAAMRLLLSNAQQSAVSALAGVVAGVMYHSGFLGLRKLKLPKLVENLLQASIGRVLGGPTTGQQIFITPAATQGGAGGFGGVGLGGLGVGGEPIPARPRTMPPIEPSDEAVQQLLDMGFDAERARQALRQANNNVEVALQTLL
jgi:UBA/TS-N domain